MDDVSRQVTLDSRRFMSRFDRTDPLGRSPSPQDSEHKLRRNTGRKGDGLPSNVLRLCCPGQLPKTPTPVRSQLPQSELMRAAFSDLTPAVVEHSQLPSSRL